MTYHTNKHFDHFWKMMIDSFEEYGLIEGKDIMQQLFDDVYRRQMTLEAKFRCFWVGILMDAEFYDNLDMDDVEKVIKKAFVDSIIMVN
jgi:hypothetical protein